MIKHPVIDICTNITSDDRGQKMWQGYRSAICTSDSLVAAFLGVIAQKHLWIQRKDGGDIK